MPFVCNLCSKVFARRTYLNTHMASLHMNNDFHKYSSKCLEENCHTSFKYIAHLREHLQISHGKLFENETLYFSTEAEFHEWKNSICKNNNVQYNCMKRNDLTYFNCNRSGHFRNRNNPKNSVRCSKSQGSCKINRNCTSQIILKNIEVDKYRVDYIKTHYGHDIEVQHIRIPREDRINIATKLSSGVPVARILDSYRDSIEEEKLSRCDIITRKDINNVKTAFNINIQEGVRHENDAVSVDLLVNEAKDFVLLHKKQGEPSEILDGNDFCIIFMNATQKSMLQRFGSSIVAIDSTHGLNMYDFELTTLMVIDEFGEGFPTACMFSNRKDTLIYEIFFQKIKEKAGLISPNVFMSDITEVYYNAWNAVMMGDIPHRLYCAWHIDKAWRTNLSKISKIETRKEVYKTLKVLQCAITISEFERNFESIRRLFHNNPDTQEFAEYFFKKYSNNRHMWASCYRKDCGINTNMVLESMHKTLKYFYLDGRIVKRLDKGITAVLKYTRDKIVNRLIKITKGFNNCHIQYIHKRHRVALTTKMDITNMTNNTWIIQSENGKYQVSKNEKSPEENCKLKCSFCKICIHDFECTCADFYITGTICKHIHFIKLNVKDTDECKSEFTSLYTEETTLNLKTLSNYGPTETRKNVKEDIEKACLQLLEVPAAMYENENGRHVVKLLQTCVAITSLQKSDLNKRIITKITNSHEPSNKKIKKQDTFFSTKKKYKENTNSIKRPTNSEISIIKAKLNIENEHDYT